MIGSLRHLRIFLTLAETGSVTRAAERCAVTQPAVTQAIAKLERSLEAQLFERASRRFFPTPYGEILIDRASRAFAILDPALSELAPRLKLTVTSAQLQALVAVVETEGFSPAARRLGLAQPTIHRAVRQIENEAGYELFDRTPHGVIPKRNVRALAIATRLALAELDQAQADIGDLLGREVGRIVIGAMPLSRASVLGPAIARFRKDNPKLTIWAVEGPYDDQVLGLRRGEIDFLIGALRPAEMYPDLKQMTLFFDDMVIVARPDHPFLTETLDVAKLANQPWVVAPKGTPTRHFFDNIFGAHATSAQSIVETGSLILMRELLRNSDHLGFIATRQVRPEIEGGALAELRWRPPNTSRPIGLTIRSGWQPTRAQTKMLNAVRWAAQRCT